MRPYLDLLHFGPSVMTTVAAGCYILLLAHGTVDPDRLALLLAVQLAAQFAISLANDYCDAPYDRLAQPAKPIPAGIVGRAAVGRAALLGIGLTLLLAVPLGPSVLLLTGWGLGAGLAYDAGLKRTPASPLPFMLGFGVLPLWAAAGVGAPLAGPPLAGAGLTAVLAVAVHLADTLPDVTGDHATGARGLAHLLGPRRMLPAAGLALSGGLLLALLLTVWFPPRWPVLAGVLALAGVLLAAGGLLYGRRGPAALPAVSGLIEVAAMITALGWLAAVG